MFTVCAASQTKGRGRLRRAWVSPVGGLWFSVLFKDKTAPPSHYQRLLGVSALLALEALDTRVPTIGDCPGDGVGRRFFLKWPNDLVFLTGGTRFLKVAGILQENLVLSETKACIVGVGINVNNPIPEELREKAGSLREVLCSEIPIDGLLQAILQGVAALRPDVNGVLRIWRHRSLLQRGSQVEIYSEAEGTTHRGELAETPVDRIEILCSNGERRSFFAGDVRLCEGNPAEGSLRRL